MRWEEDAGSKNLLNVTAPLPLFGGSGIRGGGAEEQLQPQWEDSIPDTSSYHSRVGGVTETFSPC